MVKEIMGKCVPQCFQKASSLGKLGYPFPKRQILHFSKLKEFAEFDENGRKFSKRVDNTVGKGEIACYEQLSFSQCFQRTCTTDM